MLGIRKNGPELFPGVKDSVIHWKCCLDTIPHAGNLEVVVLQRRVDEYGSGGQTGQDVTEVEGHLLRILRISFCDARHVPFVTPTREVTLHVLCKGSEPAARDNHFDSIVKGSQEERIVPPQGMANHPNSLWVDFGQRL